MLISTTKAEYDLIIVGGGMVGASFALHMAQAAADQEISILVVEAVAANDQANQPSFDARSTALSWGSREIFAGMGLWEELRSAATAIKEIQVSDQGHLGATQMHQQEQDAEALGYVIENRSLGSVLMQALQTSTSIELLAPARIESIRPMVDGMSLGIRFAEEAIKTSASLVVLADGGRSPICQQLGIAHSHKAYEQSAVITNIGFSEPHKNIAYERFTDSGPLAVLPLAPFKGQSRASLVWTVEQAVAHTLVDCEEKDFLQRLAELFGSKLGTINKAGQRFCYPLALSEAKEQIRPGLVLLGNVAHTLHPVAGQGFNLALRDSSRLAMVLGDALQAQQAPGSMAVLQTYLDQQSADQKGAIAFTNQIVNLFSSNRSSKVLARKAGLLSLDLLPPLRKALARRAMGMPGSLS